MRGRARTSAARAGANAWGRRPLPQRQLRPPSDRRHARVSCATRHRQGPRPACPSRKRTLCLPLRPSFRSIVVVVRHYGIARRDVAVCLFPRRLIGIDLARRDVAVGFTTRAVAAPPVPLAVRAALAAPLILTFRAKL